MTILPAGVFVFAPALSVVAYRLVAPVDLVLGVFAAVLALGAGVWLWPLVAYLLCWPFMPSEPSGSAPVPSNPAPERTPTGVNAGPKSNASPRQ